MKGNYHYIEGKTKEYIYLTNIKSLLDWDTSVNLPKDSFSSRAQQLNLLDSLISRITRDSKLLELVNTVNNSDLNAWQKRNLELMKNMLNEHMLYDDKLIKSISQASLKCEMKWRVAKAEGNFNLVKSEFQALISLIKEKAQIRAEWKNTSIYDALIDIYSPEVKCSEVNSILSQIGSYIPTVIAKIRSEHNKDYNITSSQVQFERISNHIVHGLGFNMNQGRIDSSAHPFCGGHSEDVRISYGNTTAKLLSKVLAVIHECGHGLYLQGLPNEWTSTLAGQFAGYAAHEASALLYEFFISKSDFYIQYLQSLFTKQGINISCDLSKALRKVEWNNPIRIDADPVTYPLHIILRTEIEKQLFEDKLQIADMPEYWRHLHKKLFGYEITSDTDGCLQDIHWYIGYFGYFPSYAIGVVCAAQLYFKLGLDKIAIIGKLCEAKDALTKNFYQHGSLYKFSDLVKKATGESLNPQHYFDFINTVYV